MSALTLVPTTKKRTSVEEPDECPLFDLRLEKRPRKGSPSSPTKRDRTREKDRSRDRSGSKSGRHKDREKKDRERAKEQEAAAALVQHSFLSSPSEVKAESGVVVSSSTSNSLKSSGKHSKSSSLRSSGGRGGSGGTPPPAVILSNLGNYPPRPPSATVARSIAPALASAPSSPAHIRDDSSPPAARPPTPNATTPSPPTGQPSSQTSSASAHQKLPAIASLLEYADMASKKQKHRDAKAAAVQKSTSADLLSSSSSPSLLSSSSGLPSVVVALSSSSSSLSASSSPSPSSSSSSSSVPKSYSPSSSSSSSTTSSTSSSSSSSPSPSSSSLSASSSSSSSSSTSSSSSAPPTAGSFLSPSSPPRLPSQGKSSLASSSLSSSPSPSALLSHSSPAVLTNIAGSAESLQQAAAASKTPRGPSSKDSSRLFGVVWMLRGVLPSTRPPFVTERQWQNLLTDTSIVTIIRFEAGTLTLRFPEEYDTVVHSRAIYGPTLTRYTEPIKTRFRWWSDCSVDQISPIKNLKISQTHVERKITLPKDITSHPFLRGLYKSPSEHPRLLWELSDFFEDLLHAFLHPKDIDALDTSGFGRSRKRLLTTCDDSSRAFDETLASNIARWDRVVDTNEPPRSRRDTVRFGFGERYPEPEDVVHNNNNSSSSSSHGGVPTTSVTQSPTTTTTTSPPSMMMTTMATPTRPHALAAYQQALSASAPMALLPTPPVYATTSTSRTPSPPSATPSFMQVHAKLSLAATPGRVAMPTSIVPMPASATQGHFASTHAHVAYATMTAAGHLPIAPVPVHRVPIQPQAPGAPMSLYTACPPTTPAPSSLPISTSQSSTQSHTNSSPTASSSPSFSLAARTSTVSIPTQLTQPPSPPVTGTPVSPSNPSNSVAPVVTATDDDIREPEQLTPTEARPIVAPSDSASLESPLNESEATSGQAESAAVSDDP